MQRDELINQFMDVTKLMMKAWKGRFFEMINDPSLSPAQIGILFILQRRESCSGRELADELHISRSAVTQLLEGLFEQGYIDRQEDAADRRVTHLQLSAAGLKKMLDLEKARKQLFDTLTHDLSNHELETMVQLNLKITHALKK